MKKLTVVFVLALVLCLAAPALAFTDVPAGHWAAEYLDEVVATGIITGFPDGTFGGDDSLTRYQAAIITARIMGWVMDNAGDGLDMNKVVKELQKQGLSGAQAEEVIIMIRALTLEFRDDIEALNESIAGVDENIMRLRGDLLALLGEHFDLEFMVYKLQLDVEELQDRVAELEEREIPEPELAVEVEKSPVNVSLTTAFSLDYAVIDRDTNQYNVVGPGTGGENISNCKPYVDLNPDQVYKNPFSTHVFNAIADAWVPNAWTEGFDFSNAVTLGINGERNGVKANLALVGLAKYYDGGTNAFDLAVRDITGSVEAPDFSATFANNKLLQLRPYAFGATYFHGMGLTYDKGLLYIGQGANLAYTYGYDLFDLVDGRVFLASTDILDMTAPTYVVGLENNLTLGGLSVGAEVAFSDLKAMGDHYMKFSAGYSLPDVMDLDINAAYQLTSATFAPLAPWGFTPATGFNVNLGLKPFGSEIEAWYRNYDNIMDKVGGSFAFEKEFGIFDIELGTVYDHDLDTPELFYHDRLAAIGVDIGKFARVGVEYSYADGTEAGLRQYMGITPCTPSAWVSGYHDVGATVTITPLDLLTIDANLVYDIDGSAFRHNYKAALDWNFLSADVAKYFGSANDAIVANVAVNPDFELLGFTVKPHGSFGYNSNVGGGDSGMKYKAAIGLEKDLFSSINWDGNFSYEHRATGLQGGAHAMPGTFLKYDFGFGYEDWANLKAEVGNFTHDTDATLDYKFKAITGSLRFTF